MNKLPWFTHRNDSHEDDWHQELIRKFGMEGYGRLWVLTELFDRHGNGDWWETDMAFLREKLRCKSKELHLLLNFFSTSSRLVLEKNSEEDENVLRISLIKFRKIHAKLKSKARSILPQHSSNTPSIHPKSKSKIEEEDNYLPRAPIKGVADNGHRPSPTQQPRPLTRTHLQ